MRTWLFLLVGSLGMVPCNLFSQQSIDTEKDFGIAIGFTRYQISDKLVSNIRHSGDLASLGLYHRITRTATQREINFHLIINPLKSRYEDEIKSVGTNLMLNYRYLFNIRSARSTFKFFAGPLAGLNWHLDYYNAWDESHFYWVSSYAASLDGRITYQPSGKFQFNLDVNLPVLLLVSRPPERFLYKELNPKFTWIVSRLHDDLTLTSLNHHQEINTTLDVIYTRSGKFKPGLFWRFQYLNNNLPDSREVRLATHSVGFYLIF